MNCHHGWAIETPVGQEICNIVLLLLNREMPHCLAATLPLFTFQQYVYLHKVDSLTCCGRLTVLAKCWIFTSHWAATVWISQTQYIMCSLSLYTYIHTVSPILVAGKELSNTQHTAFWIYKDNCLIMSLPPPQMYQATVQSGPVKQTGLK